MWLEKMFGTAEPRLDRAPLLKRIAVRSEFELLVEELNEIAIGEGFLSLKPGPRFNENGRNIRVRQVGRRLYALGGKELMRRAFQRIDVPKSAQLQAAWDGIGEWVF
ncbi:MAG TPA: hypothetical protein VHZ73_11210 [Vicinamibacterales bacterium]|jgi:hypothetical protein|nr:hypothetical protein [Vicinamibacterales bacterium]